MVYIFFIAVNNARAFQVLQLFWYGRAIHVIRLTARAYLSSVSKQSIWNYAACRPTLVRSQKAYIYYTTTY